MLYQSMASMSVCQSVSLNSAAAAGTGLSVFLLAGASVSPLESGCAAVGCGTASAVSEGIGDSETAVGTEAELTEGGTVVTGAARRR